MRHRPSPSAGGCILSVVKAVRNPHGASTLPGRADISTVPFYTTYASQQLNIQISDVQGIVLDELAPWLNNVTHKGCKNFLRLIRVGDLDL